MLRKLILILILILGFINVYSYSQISYTSNLYINYNLSSGNTLITSLIADQIPNEKINYKFATILNWLTTTTCNLKYNLGKVKANWNINSNPIILGSVVNYLKNPANFPTNPNLGNQILKNNLWMRSNVTYTLFNSYGLQNITTNQILINDTGYPVSSPWDKSYLQNEVNSGNLQPGIYKVSVNVTPIDGKCDFNSPQ